jgi:hypothetical protein
VWNAPPQLQRPDFGVVANPVLHHLRVRRHSASHTDRSYCLLRTNDHNSSNSSMSSLQRAANWCAAATLLSPMFPTSDPPPVSAPTSAQCRETEPLEQTAFHLCLDWLRIAALCLKGAIVATRITVLFLSPLSSTLHIHAA